MSAFCKIGILSVIKVVKSDFYTITSVYWFSALFYQNNLLKKQFVSSQKPHYVTQMFTQPQEIIMLFYEQ